MNGARNRGQASNDDSHHSRAGDERGSSERAWYEDPIYQRYWNHCSSIHEWLKHHDSLINGMTFEHSKCTEQPACSQAQFCKRILNIPPPPPFFPLPPPPMWHSCCHAVTHCCCCCCRHRHSCCCMQCMCSVGNNIDLDHCRMSSVHPLCHTKSNIRSSPKSQPVKPSGGPNIGDHAANKLTSPGAPVVSERGDASSPLFLRPQNTKSGSKKRSKKSSQKSRRRRRRSRRNRSSCTSSVVSVEAGEVSEDDDGDYNDDDGDNVIDGSAEMEMGMTEELVDFLAQSAKHRAERDLLKQKAAEERKRNCEKDEYIEITECSAGKNIATVLPPREPPGSRRTSEMKELYGAGAAMIQGMETAMQLSYDRNLDRRQPKLWPALPINITFND